MLDEEGMAYYSKGKKVKLTNIEVVILSYLISNKDRVVPYRELNEVTYGETADTPPKKLITWVHRLNKKLKGEIVIRSKVLVGYRLRYIGGYVL